ncbi:lipopolysaccharide biosynthesis protein [Sphingomonas sp. BK481]|uniref:lipopolysaccharide biosynthesis protein n=1 Tax=Sphingomonas sp. BK481 TaxID=2586981 RepID=UPI00161D4977|nr:lipopolysaccharide biosynthesis protein [Sphingomonas sp. BK481]MBB3585364.1 O-antigen/teichoic acid export membrane protein [Sphingomonas sp. BK481]
MTQAPAPSPTTKDFGGVLRSAARNLGWLLASRSVLAILSLFYLGFATRTLGVVDFGRFALITGAVQALTTFVGFQTWQIIVQYGVQPLHDGDSPRLARLFRLAARLDLSSAILGALLTIGILQVWANAFGIPRDLMHYTLVFAVIQLLTIRSTPLGILRLRDKFSLSALADSMTPVIRFVGAGAAMLFDPTIRGFMIAWAAAELVTAATYWIMVWRSGDFALMLGGRSGWRALVAENPGVVKFALSTNASATLGLSSKQIPLLLVGASIGPAAAGAFRLAAQVAQALAKLSQLLSRAAFPEIVRAVRTAAPERLRYILVRTMLASSAAALAILAVVALIGEPMLKLVGGKSFGSAYPVLLWLAAAGCFDLATVSLDTVLTAVNRAGTVFAIRVVGVVLLFIGAFALMPLYGSSGVAMGVAIGSVAVAILLGFAAANLTRSRP